MIEESDDTHHQSLDHLLSVVEFKSQFLNAQQSVAATKRKIMIFGIRESVVKCGLLRHPLLGTTGE